MLRNCFGLLLVCLCILSCTSDSGFYSKYLNTDSLSSQFFTISNTSDTTVKTRNGALLKITKGSFSANEVKLEIKEAYTMEQMILGGLTTQSDGKPLSSGGMIYINAVDADVKINKPLNISIPTSVYDERMQLFKGEESNGKINWTDPKPLQNNSEQKRLEMGRIVFQQNCQSCHTLDKDLTGPALSGLEGRGPWNDRQKLIEFTENPGAFIPKTCYTKELQHIYGSLMPSYPHLGDTIMNAMYDYIRNEDLKKGIDLTNTYNSFCDDSCWVYDSLKHSMYDLSVKRQEIIALNKDEERVKYDLQNNRGGWRSNDRGDTNDKIRMESFQSLYYQFDIKAMGWYNIDQMIEMNQNLQQASLKVKVQGKSENGINVYLVIPSLNVFDGGGKLTGGDEYGFYKKDGTIPLPLGRIMYVFAIGEGQDKVLFDFKKFTAAISQEISLNMRPISKEEFNATIQAWSLSDISIKTKDTKIREELKKADSSIKQAIETMEKYRPKNCNCNCGAADSVSVTESLIPRQQ